ncbi:histidine phosphatase family protein [Caldimonas tepidiphila]|uniref:histidine phosphatase family protein n=1 Tax=Caldimonas tepidiphila TaxID=2315841 RepID=UPI000E5B1C43|nr:histidine phosphatase family protein [Caldimonas tepidiphila]
MPHSEVTRVIAIRHGETAWNVDTRIQGHLDIPLNDTGRWQARRMAAALADAGIDAIYASDLSRAHATAQALADATGRPVVADTGLRERCFGSFEGRTFAEIEAQWPEEALRWRRRDPEFGPPGGETLRGFFERVVATASRLAAAHPGQTVAMVAHGGVLDCLYRAASRVDLLAARTWQLGNASINRLLYMPEGFTLVGWGDTMHLQGEGTLDESNDPQAVNGGSGRVGHAA